MGRRRCSSSGDVACKFVAVAKERAEARFVLEYRQLVSAKSMPEFQKELQQLELPRSALAIGVEMGRGQSGVVYRGTLSHRGVDLAIKTRDAANLVVGGAAAVADEALMLEAMLLNGLRHPGIVAVLAVVTVTAPVLVCMELMENGNLRDYLRTCRPPPRAKAQSGANPQAAVFTPRVIVSVAAKLGSAMAYIEHQRIIHRDIAARNVLVGKGATDVKMADLGAARNVHRTNEAAHNGVYTATTDHSPARWMALEALRNAQFSHKSDVFAFGVLLWEILSLGQTPWGAFGVPNFTQALSSGDRLKLPPSLGHRDNEAATSTAKTIYGIALRCWKEDPLKRPPFHQLEAELATHLTIVATAAVAPAYSGGAGGCGKGVLGAGADVGNPVGNLVSGSGIGRYSATADTDGYVYDSVTTDHRGFAEGGGAGSGPPESTRLDAEGYVADNGPCFLADFAAERHIAADDSDADGLNRKGLSPITFVPVDQLVPAAANPATIIPRARIPSLYLGFDQPSAKSTHLHGDETRL
jgi:hypothetical protein